MRIQSIIAIAALLTATAACTDTRKAHFSAIGDPARVTCYSGGHVVLDDFSTGKVANGGNSDGYEFKSSTTGRLQQASGDCQVDYGAAKPKGWTAILPGLRTDPKVVG